MTIKQQGGVFGRNPTFNDVEVTDLAVTNTIGVNTSAPQRALDVLAGSSNTGVAHFSGSFSDRGLFLSTAVGGSRSDGAVKYDASSGASGSTGQHQFLTDGGLVATVKSVGIALENGKGIDFSATSGTGTSELFDDYEEGTWTPALAGSSTSGSFTYTTQDGVYTKIGNIVIASANVKVATVGTPAAGFARLTGGPFTSNGSAISSSATTAVVAFANRYVSAAMRSSGSTEVIFYDVGTAGLTTLDASLIVTNSVFRVTTVYYTG